MENTTQKVILEQYKAYNYSKEKFIDRTFQTNRFFMVTCLILLAATYITNLLTPSLIILASVCALGMFTSVLWWLNVASYADLIRVKYQKILEVLEESLPKQPFKVEFMELKGIRSDKKSFNYPDIQKIFAMLIFLTFATIFAVNLYSWVKLFVFHKY